MRQKTLLILLIIVIFFSGTVLAARELNGDQLELRQTAEGQFFYAQGNVELIYDQLRITAQDEGIYRQYSGEIEFRKNVEFFYQQYEGKSIELTGNLNQEILHLSGEAEVKGPDSFLKADQIDIYQAEDRIEVKGNVYLEYNDFWAQADSLTYYLEREFIELNGNVKGERNGEKFSASKAEINQKTEEVNLSGRATLILPQENSSSETEQAQEEEQNGN